nr:hypothetical protein [Tanacetum cinerariifolium]
MSLIPSMKTPIIDLTLRPKSPKGHQQLKATATETTTTTTILPPPSQQQQSTTDAMMMKRISDLEHIMENLIQENKKLEQRLDSHGAHLYTMEQLDIPHQVSKAIDEVVTDAVDWAMQAPLRNRFRDLPEADMKEILHQQLVKDLAEARKKKKKSRESPKTPPGSPPHQPPPPPPAEDSLLVQTGDIQTITTDGPPGQVTIQSDFFFNKDLEYLRYGSKGNRPALSILKMKAAYYPDVGLEQMVPDQMWIEEECKYDIVVMYDISHWWFQRQRFFIDRHTSKGDRRVVRTHMRILSIVRIEVFSMYGYEYMKKIVLHRTDLNEHVIAERDFKYLYPSDFEDLYLLNLHGHLNHLQPNDKKNLTTAVNLWTRHLVIRQRQIDDALDYRVKEFRINRINPSLNTRFWTRKDVDRSKAFMFAIQKRLKTMRIFRNLESFIGGRVRDGDYRLLKRTE